MSKYSASRELDIPDDIIKKIGQYSKRKNENKPSKNCFINFYKTQKDIIFTMVYNFNYDIRMQDYNDEDNIIIYKENFYIFVYVKNDKIYIIDNIYDNFENILLPSANDTFNDDYKIQDKLRTPIIINIVMMILNIIKEYFEKYEYGIDNYNLIEKTIIYYLQNKNKQIKLNIKNNINNTKISKKLDRSIQELPKDLSIVIKLINNLRENIIPIQYNYLKILNITEIKQYIFFLNYSLANTDFFVKILIHISESGINIKELITNILPSDNYHKKIVYEEIIKIIQKYYMEKNKVDTLNDLELNNGYKTFDKYYVETIYKILVSKLH